MENKFDEFCKMHNIFIHVLNNLTTKIRGFCFYIDGEYNIAINGKLCNREQQNTTLHELEHVFQNHFSCDPNDQDICEKEIKVIMRDIEQLKRKYNC